MLFTKLFGVILNLKYNCKKFFLLEMLTTVNIFIDKHTKI